MRDRKKRLLERMRGRDGKAEVKRGDLREGRDALPPERDRKSVCQRCEKPTNEIRCIYADYWVCPGCANFHMMLVMTPEILAKHREKSR